MAKSVDDLETWQSIGGPRFPNLEMLDAKIASVLKIIMNVHFKKKVSLEEKAEMEDRFLSGRLVACMIYDYFRVTGAHESCS